MKERLLEIFKQNNYQPKNFQELYEILELSEESKDELQKALNELLDEYEIFLSRKNRYILPSDAHIYKGVISIKNPDYGFITSPNFEKDFYVSKNKMGGAMDKDYVVFTIDSSPFDNDDLKQEAKVIDILERNLQFLVGELKDKKGNLYLDYESDQAKSIKIANYEDFREGDIVKAKIIDYDKNPMEAKVIEKIGFHNDIGIDVQMIASSFNFPIKFEDSTLKEVANLDKDTSQEAIRRKKPTLDTIITIDGDDAKDLDDAIGIKKLANGNFLLGVYIADVSYFVKENGAIDQEAYQRGTSVYLVDRVIPMLPTLLSNDLCSLNPNTDKLVIACEMEIDREGIVITNEIFPSVINTKYRMTYKNVNKILDGDKEVIDKYQDIYQDVIDMLELRDILNQMRVKRGALDFDVPESKVIVNLEGVPTEVILIERGESERIIEEFMLIANETVASTIYHLELPFIYRIHEQPNQIKLDNFKIVSKSLGYYGFKKKVNSKQLQDFLNNIKEEDSFLKTMLLRSMAKAIYSENNVGHYGLGSSCYTHFTSPIRRYPDLIVHRYLRKYLFNHDINASEFALLTTLIADIANQSSKKERDAIECEYQVDDMKKAEYMSNFIGEEYEGIISSVNRFGIFVSLPNMIEGLVHISQLKGRYLYDSKSQSLLGIDGTKFRLGDKVKIEVIKADKKKREIDFKIVYNKIKIEKLEKKHSKEDSFKGRSPIKRSNRVRSNGNRKGNRQK